MVAAARKKSADKLFCTVCKSELSQDRIINQSVTCSAQCARKLRGIRRRNRDLIKCRYCNQPSTPEERRQFNKWRAAEGLKPKRGRPPLAKKKDPQAEFTEMIHVH